MDRLIISSCLLGNNCKYSGGNNRLPDETIAALKKKYLLVPVCPETAGGLLIPREPSEQAGARVVSRSGKDVTAEYARGADTAESLARRFECGAALMKANSPSCGSGQIYDGTFSHVLTAGDGTAVQRLRAAGVTVYSEKETDKLLWEKD